MKNIFLFPTENSSRLSYNQDGILQLGRLQWRQRTQYVYITSDEKFKKDEWITDGIEIIKATPKLVDAQGLVDRRDWKRIILTTDQDLIKDGVWGIEDGFLEWFVKNPTCKYVELKGYAIILPGVSCDCDKMCSECEVKQETLEDAKQRIIDSNYMTLNDGDIFEMGAKLQQEQMYSEEDVRGMLEDMSRYVSTKEMRDNVVDVGYSEWVRKRDWFVNHLIKQFKNK